LISFFISHAAERGEGERAEECEKAHKAEE